MSGFRIKSSHPYVDPNPVVEEPEPEPESGSYFDAGYSLAPSVAPVKPRPTTNTITDVRTGSGGGMAIRQCVNGMSDLY